MELLVINGGQKLEIKATNKNEVIIKGYGVVFNGRDYAGDTFLKTTEFDESRIIGTPIFLEHGLEGFNRKVGEVINYAIDDFGILIEARIDGSIKAVSEYLEKIRKGLVGWSSGAASHLVERVKNYITRWYPAEFSLTTHPAEPRTIGVTQVKNISPELQSILESAKESTIEGKVGRINRVSENNNHRKSISMDNDTIKSVTDLVKDAELKARQEAEAKFNAELKAIQDAKLAEEKAKADREALVKEIREEVENELKVNRKSGYAFHKNSKPGDTDGEDGETKAYLYYLRTNDFAVKTMLEGTAGSAPAMPVQMVNRIYEKVGDVSVIRQMGATVQNVSGNQFDIVREVTGTASAVYTAEGASFTAVQSNYDKLTTTLYKVGGYIPVSTEMLEDSYFDLEAHLSRNIAKSIAARENNWFVNGNGSNAAYGVAERSALGVTAASTGTVTYNEILELIGSVHENYATSPQAAFLIKRSVLYSRHLLGLTQANYLVFQSTPVSVSGALPSRTGSARLHGVPVWDTTEMASIATGNKILLFGDFSQYVIGQKVDSFRVQRNPYDQMANGLVNFYFETRVGGDLPQTDAIKHLKLA